MDEPFQLRNAYNKENVRDLAVRIKKAYPQFDDKGFTNDINSKIEDLNFGDRSKLIRENLKKYLPRDFPKACNVLMNSMLPELSSDPGVTAWDNFIMVPVTEYIADNGLDHYDISMNALKEMTKRFSSENAIRPFFIKHPEKTLKLVKSWVNDKNVHVRRLVSEGSRPRLPLASPIRQFKKDPRPVIELLDLLKDDHELYVRRSVANNLNDIAKDNPGIVVETLTRWKKGANKDRMWVINHSLRTLYKQGNKGALELMGFFKPEVKVDLKIKTPTVHMGERLSFDVELESFKEQNLMVDYAIHFVKANGKHADKVFKLSKKEFEKGHHKLSKNHLLKQFSTRKHYSGKHLLEIIINGDRFIQKEFELSV